MKLLITLLSFACISQSNGETWDTYNDPSRFDEAQQYRYEFSALPLKASLKTIPWSETYWPSYRGSINIRWNTPTQDGFKYTPPTLAEVKAMSIDQLKELSPTEKYDLFMGHYDYPLWNEVKRIANPAAGQYTGLCDGWSIAAIQYAEPDAVTLANPDGILIPFGSSDVKALMTYASEFYFKRKTVQVGVSCRANCNGMNAGALHIILANQIGLKQEAFITERQPINEQWNQPVFAYETQAVGSAVSNVPGAHGITVRTILHYTEDLDKSYYQPVVGTPNFHSSKVVMNYVLDLDANDRVIGGTWLPGSDRVGYFWTQTNQLKFLGKMSGIDLIYRARSIE